MTELTPTLVLRAYAMGVFPMAESHDAETLFWVDPEMRGVLPLDTFHIPRRLKRTVRQGLYTVRCNSDFEGVIAGCAGSCYSSFLTVGFWLYSPVCATAQLLTLDIRTRLANMSSKTIFVFERTISSNFSGSGVGMSAQSIYTPVDSCRPPGAQKFGAQRLGTTGALEAHFFPQPV